MFLAMWRRLQFILVMTTVAACSEPAKSDPAASDGVAATAKSAAPNPERACDQIRTLAKTDESLTAETLPSTVGTVNGYIYQN